MQDVKFIIIKIKAPVRDMYQIKRVLLNTNEPACRRINWLILGGADDKNKRSLSEYKGQIYTFE